LTFGSQRLWLSECEFKQFCLLISVVLIYCSNGNHQVNEKRQFWGVTLNTAKPINRKFFARDYVGDMTLCVKNYTKLNN